MHRLRVHKCRKTIQTNLKRFQTQQFQYVCNLVFRVLGVRDSFHGFYGFFMPPPPPLPSRPLNPRTKIRIQLLFSRSPLKSSRSLRTKCPRCGLWLTAPMLTALAYSQTKSYKTGLLLRNSNEFAIIWVYGRLYGFLNSNLVYIP